MASKNVVILEKKISEAKDIRLSMNIFNGATNWQLRYYWKNEDLDKFLPSKKGVTLTAPEFKNLLGHLKRCEQLFEEHGKKRKMKPEDGGASDEEEEEEDIPCAQPFDEEESFKAATSLPKKPRGRKQKAPRLSTKRKAGAAVIIDSDDE